MIYLDNAATTPPSKAVIHEYINCVSQVYGNPSSIHTLGSMSLKKIIIARERVAELISATPSEIIFTSGGTESNNLAILGMKQYLLNNNKCVLVSGMEHHSVLNSCAELQKSGIDVITIPVDKNGLVDYYWLDDVITTRNVGLISVMYANNETGIIQDINRIGRLCKNNHIFFHCDAVQAIGHSKINVKTDNIDILSVSGHKIHAGSGVGYVYIRDGVPLSPIIFGGKQEFGLRAGTENIVGISCIGIASKEIHDNFDLWNDYIKALKYKLLCHLYRAIPCKSTINENICNILPNIISLHVPNIDNESLLLFLDIFGICVSAGSACTAGDPAPSHVLKAMGIDNSISKETIRISLSRYNTREDVINTAKAIISAYETLSDMKEVN